MLRLEYELCGVFAYTLVSHAVELYVVDTSLSVIAGELARSQALG